MSCDDKTDQQVSVESFVPGYLEAGLWLEETRGDWTAAGAEPLTQTGSDQVLTVRTRTLTGPTFNRPWWWRNGPQGETDRLQIWKDFLFTDQVLEQVLDQFLDQNRISSGSVDCQSGGRVSRTRSLWRNREGCELWPLGHREVAAGYSLSPAERKQFSGRCPSSLVLVLFQVSGLQVVNQNRRIVCLHQAVQTRLIWVQNVLLLLLLLLGV